MTVSFTPLLGLRSAVLAIAVIGAAGLGGCATGPNANPNDPLEPLNRSIYGFNTTVDKAVLKPVATAYQDAVPGVVRLGVTHFFSNLGEIWSFVNNAMQLKGADAAESVVRFGTNTVFGVFGLFDVASDLGIASHKQDFGQTLGHWGVPSGPYVVLPLLGPSTIRDAAATYVDYKYDVTSYRDPIETRTALGVLRIVNTRANLLSLGTMLEEAALDKYSFTRDAYLQRRRSLISDGDDPSGGEDAPPQ